MYPWALTQVFLFLKNEAKCYSQNLEDLDLDELCCSVELPPPAPPLRVVTALSGRSSRSTGSVRFCKFKSRPCSPLTPLREHWFRPNQVSFVPTTKARPGRHRAAPLSNIVRVQGEVVEKTTPAVAPPKENHTPDHRAGAGQTPPLKKPKAKRVCASLVCLRCIDPDAHTAAEDLRRLMSPQCVPASNQKAAPPHSQRLDPQSCS